MERTKWRWIGRAGLVLGAVLLLSVWVAHREPADDHGVRSRVSASPRASVVYEEKIAPNLDLTSETLQPLTLCPLEVDNLEAVEARVRALGGSVLERVGVADGVPRVRVLLAGSSVAALAEMDEVLWIERYVRPRLFNDVAVSNTLMNVAAVWRDHGLTGRGQVITTSDSGIDTGDFATLHADLRPNVIGFALAREGEFTEEAETTCIARADLIGHGTHTAGSLVGTGAKSAGRFKGVAYEAKLWAWFCAGENGYIYMPPDLTSLFRPSGLGPTNAYIHSASWGGNTNVYSSGSQALDTWCWNNPDFLPVFAAGNDGADCTVSEEGAAKNVLCVGASESYRPNKGSYADNPSELAKFSSRGPMPDGRIKPDICAPGTYIVSTRSSQASKTGWGVYNADYFYNSGTSMATPLTAGAVTLIRQWLVEQGGFTNRAPSAALMKAIVTGGATRLGTAAPNKDFGWGCVNLGETLFPSNGLRTVLRDYIPFGWRSSYGFTVTVTEAVPLDVQLCWIDLPAYPWTAQTKSLVIDLDLVVSNHTTGVVYSPNDHINNLESVRIERPDPGTYSIYVKGPADRYSVPRTVSAKGGAAAVYLRGAVEEGDRVALDLQAYDAFRGLPMYPACAVRTWVPRAQAQTLTASDSPLLKTFPSADGGLSVAVADGAHDTLRFTGFRVQDACVWHAADHYRPAASVTLPMTASTRVAFAYADASAVLESAQLPYWWWARNFEGAVSNGTITAEAAAATGDPDGDGFDNASECAEPTDPWDALSFPFRFTEITPAGVTFVATPTGAVWLQHVERLGDTWTNVWDGATTRASVTNRIDFSSPTARSGFYRMLYAP